MSAEHAPQRGDGARIMRLPEVRRLTGLGRSTIWRLERANAFPRRILLGENAVGWYAHEIYNWLESRPRAGGAGEEGVA